MADWDESGLEKEMWVDVKCARIVEHRVVEAILKKVQEHFDETED